MEREEAMARLHGIVDGIDREDSDDGWWETSFGAEFGAGRLRELEKLISDLTE